MGADYRSIQTRMWREDEWFQSLDVDARLFWIYLFTNPSASPAGIYRLPIRTMAFESGVNADRIEELFGIFTTANKAHYADGVVWVVNMRRLQFPTLVDGSREWQTAVRIAKDIDAIPDRCPLKAQYVSHSGYPIIIDTTEGEKTIRRVSIDYAYRIDAPSIPHQSGIDTPSNHITKLNETKLNETVQEQSPADAVPVAPKTFADEFSNVQAELKADGSNKAAILRGWYIRCFGEGGAPDYSYIGKVAKQVGGAGHLAALFMQLASRPPNGDVLAYIVATHKNKADGASYYQNGTTEGYTLGTFNGSEK